MRRRIVGLVPAIALLLTGVTASSSPASEAYFTSSNVERIGSVPLDAGSAGARIVGERMYVTTSAGLQIFDISKPEKPRELGSLTLPLEPAHFGPEDVDTNGKVLIVRGLLAQGSPLHVIDVSDPTTPEIVAEIPGAGNHTTTCVLDCTYAYGSSGTVVDLTPITGPRVVGDWTRGKAGLAGHDLTEIRPGVLVSASASNPMVLLDARKDPVKPKHVSVAHVIPDDHVHSVEWPRYGRDRFLLVGSEADGPPRCGELNRGAMFVFDASHWGRGGGLKKTGEYRLSGGVFVDGRPPVNTACGHWLDPHPTFSNGGLVAMAWYEHGVRFLNVTPQGKIEELGYFLPVDGSTSAAYWVTDDIVYATDYNARGIDILRLQS